MATKREMLNVIANGEMNEEVMAWAVAEIEKMNHANELRRNKVSKKAQENAPIVEAIVASLTDEPQTATVIGEKVGISTQKASALLRQIVEAGNATKVDVKIKGKGTQKGYLVG
jgi:predicted Rossmann fold nucleotide-binding protein DprA/Smf involved in DNA uptake